MGKRMFGSLEEQLTFAGEVGLDPNNLKPQALGIAFGAAQAEMVAANEAMPEDALGVVHDEVLETVPSLNE